MQSMGLRLGFKENIAIYFVKYWVSENAILATLTWQKARDAVIP